MKIYTGTVGGKKLEKLISLNMGIMISPSPNYKLKKEFSNTFCALDNGAFQSFVRGFPFMEKYFWETLEECWELGFKLDFIVIPDIVAGGRRSLEFSVKFKQEKLSTSSNLALVVQDGISPTDVDQDCLIGCSHIFVGGTKQWKWKTAKGWSDYAKSNNKKLHIGRCGTRDKLSFASSIGTDSVDSTSFARNDSFDIATAFKAQMEIFGETENPLPPCMKDGKTDTDYRWPIGGDPPNK